MNGLFFKLVGFPFFQIPLENSFPYCSHLICISNLQSVYTTFEVFDYYEMIIFFEIVFANEELFQYCLGIFNGRMNKFKWWVRKNLSINKIFDSRIICKGHFVGILSS